MFAFGMPAVATLFCAGAALGCAAVRADLDSMPREEPAVVRVTNQNWQDVTVYALRNGVRYRLGTVNTLQTRSFRLPAVLIAGDGAIELLIDPIGSSVTHCCGPMLVGPGREIVLSVEQNLKLTSWAVW